jgi:50S ribosomal subunit-associated GTPase HflX
VVVEQKGGVQRFLESRVVDAADPAFRSHIQVTKEVLEDIGEGKLPFLVILNKIDIVDSSRKALLEKEFPEAIAMSALNPEDIEALHSRLVTFSLHGYADWNPDPTKVSIL